MFSIPRFRKALTAWYERNKRELPWRNTTDPYRIWISEIMLQQTRVTAVIPYYERFLARFPTLRDLASAPEEEVLALWAGLGYYSRARNMQKAAGQIAEQGSFPQTYDAIRQLAGVGDYTAAAIASIAFHQPHAVLDGNVMRVLSRLDNDASDISSGSTRERLRVRAQALLDVRNPAVFNQAMMELGATLCLPRTPQCLLCPVASCCEARRAGTQDQLPIKQRKQEPIHVEQTLLLIRKDGGILMRQRPADSQKLGSFWELPESSQLPQAILSEPIGEFRHTITHYRYRVTVVPGHILNKPKGFSYIDEISIPRFPVSTATKKALACFTKMNVPERSQDPSL